MPLSQEETKMPVSVCCRDVNARRFSATVMDGIANQVLE